MKIDYIKIGDIVQFNIGDNASSLIQKMEEINNGPLEESESVSDAYKIVELNVGDIYRDNRRSLYICVDRVTNIIVSVGLEEFLPEEGAVTISIDNNIYDFGIDSLIDLIMTQAELIDEDESTYMHLGRILSANNEPCITGYLEINEPYVPMVITLDSVKDTMPYMYGDKNMYSYLK